MILKSTVEGYDRLDRVEICQVSPELNTDIVIFRGLISSIRGTLFTTEVQILGMKAFLKRKILLADVAGTMNMSLFLTSICNSWNTQTGDSLTYSIPYDFSVTVDAKTGDNFFGVITDLIASKQVTIGTSLSYLLFDFDLIKITIAPLLGIDRTIPGDTYMCAYYSLSDIHDSTVQDVTMIDDDITANYLIVKNPTYSLTSDPSRMNFPKLGYYYDTPNKTNYLSILQTEHSHQKNIEITLSQIFLKKYGVTNLAGDKIVVDIVKNQYVSYQ